MSKHTSAASCRGEPGPAGSVKQLPTLPPSRSGKTKAQKRAHFDGIAQERDRWRARNAYYYADLESHLRFLVPGGVSVLEIGCGTGDLLASLKPSRGVGIDFSQEMVAVARSKYPSDRYPALEFQVDDAEELQLEERFDYVVFACHSDQALAQSVIVPAAPRTSLSIWYRSSDGQSQGTLNVYLNDKLSFSDQHPATLSGKPIADQAANWLVANIDAGAYAGQSIKLRIEYAGSTSRSGLSS